ncbi:hypothetical protein PPGU16_77850 (plasmid) [Paraburkholderia largidicola]|uniref:Uncharacterized protein n=1 Tax=Paraburkholderia largidicola TaxID=3014751 RepID=A0A7I8C2Q3_9BURK|nr:hypothetical protein PPGU16_77850 [Paraburkholderia sp. PGU16]
MSVFARSVPRGEQCQQTYSQDTRCQHTTESAYNERIAGCLGSHPSDRFVNEHDIGLVEISDISGSPSPKVLPSQEIGYVAYDTQVASQ